MGHVNPNCFVCCFKQVLKFGCIGMTPLRFNCPHSEKPSEVYFKKSRFLVSASVLVSILITISLFDDFRSFWYSKMTLAETLMLVNETMLCLCTSLMFITSFIKGSKKCLELQSICEIIQDGERRGIIFFKPNFGKVAAYSAYASITAFFITQSLSVLHFLIQDDYDITTLKIFITDCVLPLELSLSLHYVLLILLFQHMFRRIFLQIKFALSKPLQYNLGITSTSESDYTLSSAEEIICAEYSRRSTLVQQLTELRRIYSSIFFNYSFTQDFMSPSVLVWWVTLILSLTITNFLVIKCNQELKEFGILYVFRSLKGYVDFVMMIMYLTLMESTTKVVSL